MSDLGETVFGHILPGNRDGLEYALERLTLDHFSDGIQRTFWTILSNYADRYADVFTGKHLISLLTNAKVERTKILLYAEFYRAYCDANVPQHAFQYAVEGLRKSRVEYLTGQAITEAWEIFRNGREIEGVKLEGDSEARDYLTGRLADLEASVVSEETPEGDMRQDGDSLWEQYLARRDATGVTSGIPFGITSLDEVTGGLNPGELCLFAAMSNQGKSQMCAQLAWNTAINEGKAVFFATSETVRDTTMRRIAARHSRLPQFGLPQGLDLKKIKNGTLSNDEEAVYQDVLKDLKTNDNYAPLHIAQIPGQAKLSYIQRRAEAINRKVKLELAIMDYLQLLKPVTKRAGEREEYNEILRDSKTWCPSFDHGRGIAFVSPWQMSRDAFKTAKDLGSYSMGGLSDTSEAEKSVDLIVTLLRPDTTSDEAFVQVLKNRDGPLMDSRPVFVDFRCAYIGESHTMAVGASELNDGDDLLGIMP